MLAWSFFPTPEASDGGEFSYQPPVMEPGSLPICPGETNGMLTQTNWVQNLIQGRDPPVGDGTCTRNNELICIQLLDKSARPLTWSTQLLTIEDHEAYGDDYNMEALPKSGEIGSFNFWEITGQTKWQWDQEIRDNGGDSSCIDIWNLGLLVDTVGCDNLRIRCDAMNLTKVTLKYRVGSFGRSQGWLQDNNHFQNVAPGRICLLEQCMRELLNATNQEREELNRAVYEARTAKKEGGAGSSTAAAAFSQYPTSFSGLSGYPISRLPKIGLPNVPGPLLSGSKVHKFPVHPFPVTPQSAIAGKPTLYSRHGGHTFVQTSSVSMNVATVAVIGLVMSVLTFAMCCRNLDATTSGEESLMST